MIEVLKKNKHLVLYIIFGVLTTVVNICTFSFCFSIGISNISSNIIAWILAVSFAFITNKIWVFDSKSFVLQSVLVELVSFIGCRVVTGLLDLAIMYIAVDILSYNAMIMKVLSNGLVIILNYVASKLVIFKKRRQN